MLQKTRVPKWDNSIFYKKIKFIGLEAYALDFKGNAKIPAITNFIVTDENEKNDIMLFWKDSEEVYEMEIYWPMSPLQAFALGLSSLGYKIGC